MTIQMIESSVGEALYLFGIMEKHQVPCSLELKIDTQADPFVGIASQPVKAEYLETFKGEGTGDTVVITLGESEFAFELNFSVSKHITDSQISLCIAGTNYAAWFNSGLIPFEGIEATKNYMEFDVDVLETELYGINKYERQLIELVRTIDFEDVLDATTGLFDEAKKAKEKSQTCRSVRPDQSEGFLVRANRLGKLAELLGLANDDYRDHIYPDEMI
ncbi:hypothetical protein [Paenibacillus lautus]|uniref:hypothetical protein n=1 Tax=Paenibacillus lautus TaxID=1401 RepID=UPI003D2E0D05